MTKNVDQKSAGQNPQQNRSQGAAQPNKAGATGQPQTGQAQTGQAQTGQAQHKADQAQQGGTRNPQQPPKQQR